MFEALSIPAINRLLRSHPWAVERLRTHAGKTARLVCLPELTLSQICHFFAHYKDLEAGKWVKVEGWVGADEAKAEIVAGMARYKADH